jgi:DNA-binding transcriptional MerR regulator
VSRLRSGTVAAAAGVHPQTLRYYERRGLLPAPERSLGGHRLYPVEAVTVLRVIKAAQRLGFTLDEVAELLGRRDRRGLPARAVTKLVEVERRIAGLQAAAATLRATLDMGCADLVECAALPHCPIPFGGDRPTVD